MKALILPLLILTSLPAQANPVCGKPVTIAVIDTGFNVSNLNDLKVKLCKTGHRDFSNDGISFSTLTTLDKVPGDRNGHGTNVVGLVDRSARLSGVDYCIVVIKFYGDKDLNLALEKSINYARQIKADVINISAGGTLFLPSEGLAVKKYLDGGGLIVAAAGNNNCELGVCQYYPAMDDKRVIVVGNMGKDFNVFPSSNYGTRVNAWEVGVEQEALGISMTGTSQAAAVHTGKIISYGLKKCNNLSKISVKATPRS